MYGLVRDQDSEDTLSLIGPGGFYGVSREDKIQDTMGSVCRSLPCRS